MFSIEQKTILQLELTGDMITPTDRERVATDRLMISQAVLDAAHSLASSIETRLGFSSPLEMCVGIMELAVEAIVPNSNQINVENIVRRLGLYDHAWTIMSAHRALFITASSMQNLPYFFIDHQTWKPSLNAMGKLVSCCRYGSENEVSASTDVVSDPEHREATCISADEYVNFAEFTQTLSDFALLMAALDLGLPVYGSCHGAHVGWLLLGGEMVKWNKYRFSLGNNGLDRLMSFSIKEEENDFDANSTSQSPEVVSRSLDENKYMSEETVTLRLPTCVEPVVSFTDCICVRTDFNHATVMYCRSSPFECENTVLPILVSEGNKKALIHNEVQINAYHPIAAECSALIEMSKEALCQDRSRRKIRERITEMVALDVGAHAVEQFTFRTYTGTQSHVFKHIYDGQSLTFVLAALGLN